MPKEIKVALIIYAFISPVLYALCIFTGSENATFYMRFVAWLVTTVCYEVIELVIALLIKKIKW